ncbi:MULTISPECIES: YegJ family protein [Mesorhizobium]|uniref:DUF2314 domain-containing protein n=1 Tax=Rhizobium loti TaxID=381 RepID=A0A6M7U0A8_RHILI|nr:MULTISPECIES: DUF2314 domain-containing protein [Mesorhizobium]KRB18447.1 hypothetical protein ASE05_27495 [Mesorhizobium sp. Root172]OBQ60691.1 hypothetical protein A8145_22400 [Mesorhizobium loti]QKC69758.1 DUF2314 domain-containing protein [Mesorhizobium loti]QKC89046.1 DUF2314 domain-containing protein [Mesorhizobium sp. NZP2234]
MKLAVRTMLSLMLALAPISARAQDSQQGDDKVVNVARDDPDMTAAIAQARASLDQFLALSDAPPAGTSDYKLKVEVRDGDTSEHFWIIPFHRTATGFAGTLANEPQAVHNVVAGQELEFTRNDVSDWGYTKNGRQVGSFTVCVLFKTMAKEDVDYYRENYGFDC